jgi:hypothetical protein
MRVMAPAPISDAFRCESGANFEGRASITSSRERKEFITAIAVVGTFSGVADVVSTNRGLLETTHHAGRAAYIYACPSATSRAHNLSKLSRAHDELIDYFK